MVALITPEQKDAILSIFLENAGSKREVNVGYEPFEHLVSYEQLEAIVLQFERLGFIEVYQLRETEIYAGIRPEADQFMQRGGFYGQEILFQQSVEILLSELEKAKPLFAKQAEKVVSAIGNVYSFLALVKQITFPKR